MFFSMLLPSKYDEKKWVIAKQIGINHAITKASPELSGMEAPFELKSLKFLKENFKKHGFILYGLEGDQFDMTSIKLGLSDRDQWIEKYIKMIKNMGELEIPLLCYNFMATIGWYRTKVNIQERGGALVSGFDIGDIHDDKVEGLQITEEMLWENLHYFLEAVLPEAQKAGIRMALHPDDPPVSPLKGIGRILTNIEAFEDIYQRYPIRANAITFCQATFKLMTDDFRRIAKKWLNEDRVAFLHIRDVSGDKFRFQETFHDNGPTDMVEMFRIYNQHGFRGPVRPDHAPAMYGETQENFHSSISVGYDILGKIFAIGYLKGLHEAILHENQSL